jgi:hypothetical protein
LDQRIMDRLVAQQAKGHRPRLEQRHVLRAILRAGRGRYRSGTPECLIPNILSVDQTVAHPHSTSVRLVTHTFGKQQISEEVTVGSIVADFACAGLDRQFVRRWIGRLIREEVLPIPHMNTEIADSDALSVTPLGQLVADDLLLDREYIDALVFDTPICDEVVFDRLKAAWRQSGELRYRLRTMRKEFRDYILATDKLWLDEMNLEFMELGARHPLKVAAD